VSLNERLYVVPHMLVIGSYQKARAVSTNDLILSHQQLHPLHAGVIGTLANPLAHRKHVTEARVQLLDAFIDLAEQALILRSALRAVMQIVTNRHLARTSTAIQEHLAGV